MNVFAETLLFAQGVTRRVATTSARAVESSTIHALAPEWAVAHFKLSGSGSGFNVCRLALDQVFRKSGVGVQRRQYSVFASGMRGRMLASDEG